MEESAVEESGGDGLARFLDRDERADILEEARRYRGATEGRRAREIEALCREAAAILAAVPEVQRRRVLAWADPLPPESVALLRRLRGRHGWPA
jgi:hypothetical protein